MKYNGFLLIFCLFSSVSVANQHFAVPMGDSKWDVKGNRLYCQMTQTIPAYGDVIFRQRHASRTHLILKSWRDNHAQGDATIVAKQPRYKRHTGEVELGTAPLRQGRALAFFSADVSDNVLSHLRSGQLSRVMYEDNIGQQVKVDLPNENFQLAYAEYAKCISQLLPFPFNDVKYVTVHFDINSRHLSRESRMKLNKIRDYVNANPAIRQVKIDGYSDGLGRGGHNYHMSEVRAKSVEAYLQKIGVPDKLITVTWHGSKMPIANNDTHAGRSLNRRVSIELLY